MCVWVCRGVGEGRWHYLSAKFREHKENKRAAKRANEAGRNLSASREKADRTGWGVGTPIDGLPQLQLTSALNLSLSLSLNKLNRTHKQRRSVCGAERETDRQTEEKERRRGLPLGTVPGPFGPGTIRAVPVKDISYNHYDDKHEQFDFSFYGLVVIDSTLEGLTKVRSRLASLLWCLAALLPVPKSTLSLALSLSTQEAVESRLSYRSFGFCFKLS